MKNKPSVRPYSHHTPSYSTITLWPRGAEKAGDPLGSSSTLFGTGAYCRARDIRLQRLPWQNRSLPKAPRTLWLLADNTLQALCKMLLTCSAVARDSLVWMGRGNKRRLRKERSYLQPMPPCSSFPFAQSRAGLSPCARHGHTQGLIQASLPKIERNLFSPAPNSCRVRVRRQSF